MEGHPARIIAFYGYRSEVGCTMALANVAALMAANGLRVLVVDWVEAPGLPRFFHPFLKTADLGSAAAGAGELLDRLVGVSTALDVADLLHRYRAILPRHHRLH
ncbi:hypothetical protein [Actinacidiphila glaucinigra]|uniref:hypothetical protein n=1 Tax=Actinacidiphila glaucinigra TaxID=235986 RepID=UPI0035D722FE